MTVIPGRSVWTDTMPSDERAEPHPADVPVGGLDVDVAIVGAGLTGLWTAWYLASRDPGLRITVLERETVGFGASGRNGGWCSALLPMSLDVIARRHGSGAAHRMQQAMFDTVDVVGAFAAEHAPPGVFHRGGTIDIARSAPQVDRLRSEVATMQRFGFGDDHVRWVDADEARRTCRAEHTLGALFTPHCASVHPLRLTHALGRAVVAAGVDIREHTTVREIRPRSVVTDRGTVRAEVVVRATEGYTPELPGLRRAVLPIYSLMIATEPLPSDVWAEIGLHDRPTFADGRHLIVYGQRTADDRLAFGGRGAPYHFGSAIRPGFDTDDRIRGLLHDALVGFFPAVADARVTHHWGGVLAAARDWQCSVRFDRSTGLACAGGYLGDGVATTNLAGRTLAALITRSDDDADRALIRLPWVGHVSRSWEPEPLRWFGVNAGRAAARRADVAEDRTDRPSRWWGTAMHLLLRR
ncbi:MAG: FAD-dependent oxidoreductase [Ilumatobacteraceae bacterium]